MFLDSRLTNTPRWCLYPPDDIDMLIPQELLSSVVFLGEKTGTGNVVKGTAFFTSVPTTEISDQRHTYLVSAAHCVWNWKLEQPRTNLFARLNAPDGKTIDVDLPDGDKWCRHPTRIPTTDIAVLPWPAPEAAYHAGYRWVPRSMYFSESYLSDSPIQGLGIGDELAALGLFSTYSGDEQNEPIARTGNIALIPRGLVSTNATMGRMRIYLIELRSIEGMSGSPVFARHRAMIGDQHTSISLMGVLLGHYNQGIDASAGLAVNKGIGMVAPASSLAEVLDQEVLVTKRKKAEQEKKKRESEAQFDRVEEEYTREDFERDLTKVTRRLGDEPEKERS
jgi:hypothetical protein